MERSNNFIVNRFKMASNVFKKIGVIVFLLMFYSLINALMSDGVKSVYCLANNKCVTVWKRRNGEVYIVPGRYESNNKPTVSHIRTINKQFLTLYFLDEEGFYNKIIVRDEGNLESNQKMYTIENDIKGKWEFLEYSERCNSTVYQPNSIQFKDVKASTDYLTINIQENYAMDKAGKKVK